MLRAGSDVGGFREVGVAFDLVNQVDRLKWDRKGLWSVYPKDHIGRNEGEALRREEGRGREFPAEAGLVSGAKTCAITLSLVDTMWEDAAHTIFVA